MRVLAVIPARGGSKRLPGKNTRFFCGKPLIHWTIEFARSMEWFATIEVSTDSIDIANCCEAAGQKVERLRPSALATDEASSLGVVLDVLDWKAAQGQTYDLVALLQPTTPYRRKQHWDDALRLVTEGRFDAAVGVGSAQNHPHLIFRQIAEGRLVPWIDERPISLRAQDLEPAVVVNGALYLVKVDVLRKEKTFMPSPSAGVVMHAPVENLDIDTEFDWFVAEHAVSYFRNAS